jgi:hypothetical protein
MKTCLNHTFLFGLLGLLWTAPTGRAQYPPVSPEPGAPQLYSTQPSGITSLPGVPKVEINPPYTPNPAPHAGGMVVGGPLGPQPRGHHPHDEECVRVPSTDKKLKIEYGSVTVDYCLPSCGHHGCGCSHPRRKHFLLKRVVTTESPAYDCTPVCKEHGPGCSGPGCPAGTPMPVYQPAPPAMPGQPLPPPLPGPGSTMAPPVGAVSAPVPGTPLVGP